MPVDKVKQLLHKIPGHLNACTVKRQYYTNLHSQNSFCSGFSVLWAWLYRFPRLLPSHTSNPASASRNASDWLGRFSTQEVLSASSPCWTNTGGLCFPDDLSLFPPFTLLLDRGRNNAWCQELNKYSVVLPKAQAISSNIISQRRVSRGLVNMKEDKTSSLLVFL